MEAFTFGTAPSLVVGSVTVVGTEVVVVVVVVEVVVDEGDVVVVALVGMVAGGDDVGASVVCNVVVLRIGPVVVVSVGLVWVVGALVVVFRAGVDGGGVDFLVLSFRPSAS